MHELTITEHLLDHCIQEARSQNASRIRTIRVCIGELRGIVPDCIQIIWICSPKALSQRVCVWKLNFSL